MNDRLEARLAELREELEGGQGILAELELREATTRETLLRISGAIQVLGELLEPPAAVDAEPEAAVAALR